MVASFVRLVGEIREVVLASVSKKSLSKAELSRILNFISKVSLVAEQAFQDVAAVLVRIKYLRPDDLSPTLISDLEEEVEKLTLRNRFRDVEEICSRLHHLSIQFRNQIAPSLGDLQDQGWNGLLGLLNEHEGRLITLVHETTWQLSQKLSTLDSSNLPDLRQYASESLRDIRSGLDELRRLSNAIHGASGRPGLLELTETERDRSGFAALIVGGNYVAGDQNIAMRDQFNAEGQVAAMGPNAHVHDINFNQVWNQAAGNIDIGNLAQELDVLQKAMKEEATDANHFSAVAEVAHAKEAAQKGEGPKALEHLKKAGTWVWDVAQKIGIGVATAAAKTALGF